MTYSVVEDKDTAVPLESVFTFVLPRDKAIPSNDIVTIIRQRGESVSSLAKRFGCSREVLARVIHRHAPYLYADVRDALALWLGVDAWQVGRGEDSAAAE